MIENFIHIQEMKNLGILNHPDKELDGNKNKKNINIFVDG
jgi:hypothetical protein